MLTTFFLEVVPILVLGVILLVALVDMIEK